MSNSKKGILFALGAYVIWGFLPIYWKQIEEVSSYEIIAHRILWSFVFMILFILAAGRWRFFREDLKFIFSNKKKVAALFLASATITTNWLIFIIAVQTGHILDASLGYYINPLISVLLGFIILGEKFSRVGWVAIILVSVGVFYLAVGLGSAPWISFVLALSFSLYGLIKKTINLDAVYAMAVETFVLAPFALVYIIYIGVSGTGDFGINTASLWMIGSGIATVIPLLLFSLGVQKIRLSLIGFLQYFAPTLMLIIGVFMYDETFTRVHQIAYIFIWGGLILYSLNRYFTMRDENRREARRRVGN
ncbi:EamA family transporter RarD [Lacicoccus alkaliphilus]|uniref:Chloramphenicol-sensitive protein RarD n=1 Tax=Lacicoccus alkaliphilus DSM 16010 TaxID=1123231 RepID=A0A1M7IHR9_9BACL|nr:EamA family transporter RarD [Salinicoccus alkaliphilus]SHM40281.1 chloramphenicol-sensitive protein RarD [Salinicoccus alkaliphilus DSM 16010]